MTEFHNPFHFVPVEKIAPNDLMPRDELRPPVASQPERKQPHVTHDRYLDRNGSDAAYSGVVHCRLTTRTPTVLGSLRTEATDRQPASVLPFMVPGNGTARTMEPAIPETSLRGMVSALYEALTNSALRVLSNTAFSVRVDMRESYQAVAVVIHDPASQQRRIVPISFPGMQQAELAAPFRPFSAQMRLKIYLGNLQDRWLSHCADNREVVFLADPAASVPPTIDQSGRITPPPNPLEKNGFLVGRRLHNAELITRDDWLARRERGENLARFVPGILRNLGRQSSPDMEALRERPAGRRDDMPGNVKDVWFIPLPEGLYDPVTDIWNLAAPGFVSLPAEPACVEFERMAAERTRSNPALPFEPRGSVRNATLANTAADTSGQPKHHLLKLREGDLVCFRIETQTDRLLAGDSAASLSLSISSIWRRATGRAWDWFRAVDPNLLPMHGERTQVTLAEQLFGFADAGTDGREPDDKLSPKDPTQAPPVAALAGRLRFSTGRWVSVGGNKVEFAWEKEAITLPILGSPKPPSPRLYFRRKSPNAGVGKKELPRVVQGDVQPQGRKMYLIHEEKLATNTKLDVYKTKFPGENLKQKTRVKPLRHGQTFEFTIRFDNLSARELGLLLLALKPSAGFLHRLGMGKPLGMGVVELQPQTVELIDRKRRYAQDDLFAGRVHHTWSFGDKDWTETVDAARKTIDAKRLVVIELLGDPKSTKGHTVAYPFVDGAEGSEAELFQWHMENEKSGQPQSLPPITDKLPMLKTVPPKSSSGSGGKPGGKSGGYRPQGRR